MINGNEARARRGLGHSDGRCERGAIEKIGAGDIAHAPKAPARLGVRREDLGEGKVAAEAGTLPDPRRAALAEDVMPAKADRKELIAVLQTELEAHRAALGDAGAGYWSLAFTAALALAKSIWPA